MAETKITRTTSTIRRRSDSNFKSLCREIADIVKRVVIGERLATAGLMFNQL